MTRSKTVSFGFGFAVFAAVLFAVSGIATPAMAEPVANACDSPSITANEAERITGKLMREYGFATQKVSPRAFFILETRCIDGQWFVSVDVRQGSWIKKRAVVRIDGTTGNAELA